jgi:hypothetical protein
MQPNPGAPPICCYFRLTTDTGHDMIMGGLVSFSSSGFRVCFYLLASIMCIMVMGIQIKLRFSLLFMQCNVTESHAYSPWLDLYFSNLNTGRKSQTG